MRQKREINAVHVDEMDALLSSLGILDSVNAGEAKCGICGQPVAVADIACVYPVEDRICVCCDRLSCYEAVLSERKGAGNG